MWLNDGDLQKTAVCRVLEELSRVVVCIYVVSSAKCTQLPNYKSLPAYVDYTFLQVPTPGKMYIHMFTDDDAVEKRRRSSSLFSNDFNAFTAVVMGGATRRW